MNAETVHAGTSRHISDYATNRDFEWRDWIGAIMRDDSTMQRC
jgi:hypothetical protein